MKMTTLYVLSYNSKTVEVTGLGIVPMASKLIFASLYGLIEVKKILFRLGLGGWVGVGR